MPVQNAPSVVPRKLILLAALFAASALSFCAPGFCSNWTAVQAEIGSVMDKQSQAWNKGKLDEFMVGYLNSPRTSYTSGGTVVWGYEALKERYEKKYGQSPETMGKIGFTDLKFVELGPKDVLVIGHWHLDRTDKPAMDGVFSLVFVRAKDGWKIIHDHTSVAEKKTE